MPPAVMMRPADAAGGGQFSQPVDRHLPRRGSLRAVGLLAVGGGQPVEQPHPGIDPGTRADAGEQGRLGQGADERVQAPVVHLLAGAEAAGDEEGVHRRGIGETVVGQDGEARLRLHRPHGIGDQEGVQFRVETARYREDAVRCRKINDLGVLEHVDSQAESRDTGG